MNTELSPKVRTLVSGLAAVVISGLLMTSVIESLNPAALTKRSAEPSTPLSAAVINLDSYVTFKRRV